MLDTQKQQLEKIKDEYINNIYDPKFKRFKDKKSTIKAEDLKAYELKTINNYNFDEAITIDNIYWDMEMFVETFLFINLESLEIPLIKYLRENILEKDQYELVVCSNCGEKTYSDFNNCIKCKYPKGVR